MAADSAADSSAYAANITGTEKLGSRRRLGWLGQQMQLIKHGRRSFAADADKGVSTVDGKQLQLYYL